MNIVLAYIGHNAEHNYERLLNSADDYVRSNLPLKVCRSNDGKSIFGLEQPGGFYPLETPFYDLNNSALYMVHGYFWYRGHFPLSSSEAQGQIINALMDLNKGRDLYSESDIGGLYNLFFYDEGKKKLTILSDYSGVIPLYYCQSDGGLFLSSHLRALAKALGKSEDPVGIIQQTAFHYTVGKRTLFQDIFRLNPGERLLFEFESDVLQLVQPKYFYSGLTIYSGEEEAVDALYADFMAGIEEVTRKSVKQGMLLSGGLDSRFVAGAFHKQGGSMASVTYGDPDNFEIIQANRIAKLLSTDHIVYSPVEDCQLELDLIESLMARLEKVNFPHVASCGRYLQELGADTASTGYACDAYFGGAAYRLIGDKWGSKERLKRLLLRSAGLKFSFSEKINKKNLNSTTDAVIKYHLKKLKSFRNIFANDWQDKYFPLALAETEQDVRLEIERGLHSNPETTQQLCERFWLEQHAVKDISTIEWTLSMDLPLILPTMHHSFLVRCTNLPPEMKVDHGVYLKLFKKYFKRLASYPTGNLPIPLNFPEPIISISRALRVYYDRRAVRKQYESRGLSKNQRHGWTNFEEWFRAGDFLNRAGSYIDTEIFSSQQVERKLTRWINWDEKIYSGKDLLTLISISQILK